MTPALALTGLSWWVCACVRVRVRLLGVCVCVCVSVRSSRAEEEEEEEEEGLKSVQSVLNVASRDHDTDTCR